MCDEIKDGPCGVDREENAGLDHSLNIVISEIHTYEVLCLPGTWRLFLEGSFFSAYYICS